MCDSNDIEEANIPFASFDAADVSAMDACGMREGFLRQSRATTLGANASAEVP